MSACRSCDAPVVWVRTTAGRTMPLDPNPRPDGNIAKTGKQVQGRYGDMVPQVRYVEISSQLPGLDDGDDRYVSHFATCPDAASWRRDDDAEASNGAPS